jgi:hypothetical protein
VQANADVVAQKAAIDTALADSAAAEAGVKSMEDGIRTAQALWHPGYNSGADAKKQPHCDSDCQHE